jgi:hypothetical protein
MSRKAIDPSEILIDDNGTVRSDSALPYPWIRFLARMVDYFLFILLLRGLHAISPGPVPFGKWESLIPFEYFVWIPVEALLLWTWGKTPGKWFLNIEIRQGRRARPDYLSALKRSFHVWFRGLGLAIPFVNALCMWIAYQRLKVLKITSWDRDDHFQITHRFVPTWKLVIASIMAFNVIVFYLWH